MKYLCVTSVLVFCSTFTFTITCGAGNLQVENVRFLSGERSWADARVVFDLSWENSWRNSRNHDAAWIFIKFPDGGGYRHANLAATGHSIIKIPGVDPPKTSIEISDDRKGFYIASTESFRGQMKLRVMVTVDTAGLDEKFRGVQPHVYGIEMVYIPAGGFTLGDPDPKALEYGSFFRSNNKGEPSGLIQIESEAEMKVGAAEGSLYYREGEYVGDRSGPVPAGFPKGFNAFYVMKYELTQGLYASFLNSVPDDATYDRVNFVGRNYYENKGTIRLENRRYIAEKPNRPMNFISWDDGLAFSDWAALRPMTELEFTKASRGPRAPKPNEFPWGSSDPSQLARIVDAENNLTFVNDWTEDKLSDETLTVFGASYYWVMDLSGSLWERVMTIGSPDGRSFVGSHGDGQLDSRGNATNEDWSQTAKNKKGHGYRGGGFYFQGGREHEFNPYSPIGYRRFGGWSGENPHMAYGFRCARSASQLASKR